MAIGYQMAPHGACSVVQACTSTQRAILTVRGVLIGPDQISQGLPVWTIVSVTQVTHGLTTSAQHAPKVNTKRSMETMLVVTVLKT